MKYFLLSALLCNIFLSNSCKKYEAAPAAFFISPGAVSVAPTGTAQGTASNKITDLFLYVDGKFQGAYQTIHTMPIVTRDKEVRIDIFAGIKNNGIKGTTISWIFYDKIEFDTLVETAKTITRPITFKYNPNVTFAWLENFEGNGYSIVKSGVNGGDDSAHIKYAATSDIFEGSKSIELNLSSPLASAGIFESSIAYFLPKGNSNVYLELNYKCDVEFEVGLTDGTTRKSALTINPSFGWNKIYISLADVVNRTPAPDQQKVYFKFIKTNDNPNPHVWLDNIKLIYI